MTEKEIKDYIKSRIDLIANNGIKENIPNTNGVLVHVIPNDLNDCEIKWEDKVANHQFIIKHAFRRFSDLESVYEKNSYGVLCYTPKVGFYNCFNNGIIETFKSPISTQNSFAEDIKQIKVDNIFYQIKDTLVAAKEVHNKLYNTNPPYSVLITLLGINDTYLYSIDKNYTLDVPFPLSNARFESFVWNDLDENIMPEIISGIHYGLKASGGWNK